jgi:hypothetical protein
MPNIIPQFFAFSLHFPFMAADGSDFVLCRNNNFETFFPLSLERVPHFNFYGRAPNIHEALMHETLGGLFV